MKNNWILTSIISGIISGILTFFLTSNWKISLIITVIVLVIVLLNNPKTRYFKAFYIVVFPLVSNIYFAFSAIKENFSFKAGLKELDITTVTILGLISVICLILDYLERNDKLKGFKIKINKNSNKKVSGNNININQTINKSKNKSD